MSRGPLHCPGVLSLQLVYPDFNTRLGLSRFMRYYVGRRYDVPLLELGPRIVTEVEC